MLKEMVKVINMRLHWHGCTLTMERREEVSHVMAHLTIFLQS